MYVRMYVRTYVCMYVCMYVCIYVRTYVWMDGWMYVWIFVCMYVSMYVLCGNVEHCDAAMGWDPHLVPQLKAWGHASAQHVPLRLQGGAVQGKSVTLLVFQTQLGSQ